MARQRRANRAIWTDDLLRFGMETGFAASLHSLMHHGVDTVSAEPEIIRGIAKFLQAGKSETELRWRSEGKTIIEQAAGKCVKFTGYEWVTFKIPGGSYTADFYYLLENGHWVVVEIKGSKMQGSYRDSHTRLKAAASLNPWHTFYQVIHDRKEGWVLDQIEPDLEFVSALMKAW